MIASIVTICALSIGVLDSVDTIPQKWYIGYDQGISLRYFPHAHFGCGLIVQGPNSSLYNKSERDYKSDNINYYQENHSQSNGKSIQLFAEGYYRNKIGTVFWITPYLSLGGRYSTSKVSYSNHMIEKDSSNTNNHYKRMNEHTTKAFIGQIGVMPGIQFGRFQVEFKLGLSGSVSKTDSPDDSQQVEDTNTKQFGLTYPSDFIRSLVIHIGF